MKVPAIATNRAPNGDPSAVHIDRKIDGGLKHESSVLCDALISVEKSRLTDFVGTLGTVKLREFRDALRIALDVE